MNQKELNEIRRRFKLDKNSISRIYGCYVNSSREIIAYIDESMGLMSQEEQEMYLGLLKKALSGGLGRNLINIEFSTAQVAGSDEHRLLQAVRQSSAQDKDAREALYRRIIDAMDMGETNYLILLAADTYDVPYKGRDDETFSDGSDTVFQYFLCSICPVKAPTLELKYNNENSGFHSASTGHIALPPELGFLFPAFDDRAANIYNALFYSKNAAEIHQEVIDAVFRVTPPLSAEEQKNAFGTALGDTLQQDCSYDVVQSVHEQLRQRIVEHKESRDPQPLTLTLHEVGDMLAGSGATVRQAEAFQEECRRQYGDDAALDAKNLMESGKFQITTPEVKISVSPEYSAMIEARVIDGRKYILIPADEGVEVNGIAVNIPNPQNRESWKKRKNRAVLQTALFLYSEKYGCLRLWRHAGTAAGPHQVSLSGGSVSSVIRPLQTMLVGPVRYRSATRRPSRTTSTVSCPPGTSTCTRRPDTRPRSVSTVTTEPVPVPQA